MAEQSLKDKTVKGTFWSAADAFLGQGVTFIVGIVLARLLSPEEYGLIGIVTIFTTILLGFIDCGFGNALIRKQDVNDNDYSTMFFVNMGMSVIVYFLLFIGAPSISVFFKHPELVSLVRVTGLILIAQAFSIVQNTILSKRIDFTTKAKASLFSALMSGVVGISMTFAGFGVWSLVGQQITRQLIYSLSLWLYNRWHPQLCFSVKSLCYMWGVGWKLMLSGFVDRLWNQLNQVVVGKYYNPTTLGQYTKANEYANLFSLNLTSIVQRVSYPVISEIQDNKQRMINGYRHIIKLTMFVTAICMITMGAVAEPLVYCLIGPKWYQSALYLPLICIGMSLYPLHAINLNMLQVQNRTDLFLYLEIVKKVIAIVPIVIGILIDIYWMLVSGIVVGVICFFLNSYYSGKALGYTSWMQLKDIAPSYGISLVVAFSVYFFKYLPLSYWLILPLQLFFGVSVLLVICEILNYSEYFELKEILFKLMVRIRRR